MGMGVTKNKKLLKNSYLTGSIAKELGMSAIGLVETTGRQGGFIGAPPARRKCGVACFSIPVRSLKV
jgi:hypothetical protein